MAEPTKGVSHHYTLEQLVAFRDIPAADKLAWLEEMKQLLERALTPERLEALQRFRRGEL
jgi:hypothetical protein